MNGSLIVSPSLQKKEALSAEWLAILDNKNVGKSMLTSICQLLAVECCSSNRWYIFSMLSVLLLLSLAVFVSYVIITHHLLNLKCPILSWVCLLLPDALQPAVDPRNPPQ
jgi:hypothetical protein